MNSNETYENKKNRLAEELKNRSVDSPKISLYKTTSNLFRPVHREKNNHRIDVRQFNQVLSVDKHNLIAEVEGMTTYNHLVQETLKLGCLPAVVPELKSITVGGALSGGGIESSSFRYGLVHETIQEAEVLLGDGRIVICSPVNEYKDLFFSLPNTFGTLGYALKVKVKLISAKKYVYLTHHKFDEPKSFFEEIQKICAWNRMGGTIDYFEGVIFGKNEMYITTGQFVEEAPYASNYKYLDIYYKSIRNRKEDYLTASDYIWRWDPDWFWCSKVFHMQNPLMRWLFGKWMLNSTSYTKVMRFVDNHPFLKSLSQKISGQTESLIQDVLIPADNAMSFYEYFRDNIGIKPIWVCPAQSFSKDKKFDFCPLDPEKLYLDFGFWDIIGSDKKEGYYNREIEMLTTRLKGFKSLYSASWYPEEEFWGIYDQAKYIQLKNKYDPNSALGNLFQKCVKNSLT